MAAVSLVAVASDEAGLAVLQVPEAGDVEPAGPAVIERVWFAHELLDQARDARSHDVLAEVVTHVPARVAEAVGMLRGARQQQQAGGFERGRAHDDDLRLGLVALARRTVNEGDAPGLPGVFVDQNLMRDRVGPDRQVSGVHCRVDEPGG